MLVYSTVPGCHFLVLRVTLRNTFPGTRRLVHKHTFYICIDTPLFYLFLNPRAVGDTIKAKLVPLPRVSVSLTLYAYMRSCYLIPTPVGRTPTNGGP